MANRSYLYASDAIPTHDASPIQRRMIGISEWNYDIPVVYKLLSIGSPQACISSIWKTDQKIAICGEYEIGLYHLTSFLDRLSKELVQSLREEALKFLLSPTNRRKYFVLECGEIFGMQEEHFEEQNRMLLEEIRDFKPKVTASKAEVAALGLGNWSNILYFDLNDAE